MRRRRRLRQIHYVHPGSGEPTWDLAFLAVGVVLIGVGVALVRAGRKDPTPRGGPPTHILPTGPQTGR